MYYKWKLNCLQLKKWLTVFKFISNKLVYRFIHFSKCNSLKRLRLTIVTSFLLIAETFIKQTEHLQIKINNKLR